MIKLPNLPASSQGDPLPIASPEVASAPARSLINLGGTIAQTARPISALAQRIQAAHNQASLSEAGRTLDERTAAFHQSLLTDHDYQNYATRLESELIGPARALIDPSLPPIVRQELQLRMDDWASGQRQKVAETAQLKAITRAKSELSLTREAFRNGEVPLPQYLDTIGRQSWLIPEERNALAAEAQRDQADLEVERAIMLDPGAWLNQHQWDHLHQPGLHPAKHRARLTLARTQLRQTTAERSGEILDLIIENKIGTPEEIDHLAADLRPAARAKLKDFLSDYLQEGTSARLAQPQTQEAIAGALASGLASYRPDSPNAFDSDYVTLDRLLHSLTPGPLRDEFQRQLNAIRDTGHAADAAVQKTKASLAREQLQRAYKAGAFGPLEFDASEFHTLGAVLNTGYLLNRDRLQALGFSKSQAKDIVKAYEQDNTATKVHGLGLFRELWHQRENETPDASLSPFDLAVFQAIRDEKPRTYRITLPGHHREFEAQLDQTHQRYGRALLGLEEFLSANPDAKEAAISQKLKDLGIEATTSSLLEGLIPPRPTAPPPSPNTPPNTSIQAPGNQLPADPQSVPQSGLQIPPDLQGRHPGTLSDSELLRILQLNPGLPTGLDLRQILADFADPSHLGTLPDGTLSLLPPKP